MEKIRYIKTVAAAEKAVIDILTKEKPVVGVKCLGVNLGEHGGFITMMAVSCWDGRINLFDVKLCPKIMYDGGILRMLQSVELLKVFHNCGADCATLYKQFGITVKHFFDTQIAHSIIMEKDGLSPRRVSLHQLCEVYNSTSYIPSKDLQRLLIEDPNVWARRPVTKDMQKMAASFVAPLVPHIFTQTDRLLTRLKECKDGEIEVNHLYDTFQFEMTESCHNVKIGKRLFIEYLVNLFPYANKERLNINNTTTKTVYKGVVLEPINTQLSPEYSFGDLKNFFPDEFILTKESESSLTFDVDCSVQINGNSVFKRVTFYNTKTWELEISGKQIDLKQHFISSEFQINQGSIDTVCYTIKSLKLCEAVTFTGSVLVSRYHTVENLKEGVTQVRKLRSVICNRVIPYNSQNKTCRKCQKMTLGQPQSEKENLDVKSPGKNEPDKINLKNNTAKITKEDITNLIPDANREMVELLLSQAQNISRDPKGRRWNKEIITVCLQWYCRSPQSYEAFRHSKCLVLPSASTLVLYKNKVKQQVGFDEDVFMWMFEEARRRNIPEEGWAGGIILDEMSIQSDIQINKTGDMIELSGLGELGEEGNLCHVVRTGKNDKYIGTHALQMVFLGVTGFRFPFAHFVTDGIQAPELYTLFWEAVDTLQTFGFTAVYTCMDGAQSNRSFMHYNIRQHKETFTSLCPCSLGSMIFMMDISHVIKKIRNNIIKSGIQKGSTRLLTLLSSQTVQWQMFIDCFLWDRTNAFQLHRKLTNEHLFPSTQSKMRNHLAEEILNIDMLHLMQQYQMYLGPKGCILDGVIEFLTQTSKLIDIFRSKKPIQTKNDDRLSELKNIDQWFKQWECASETKQLMSAQCHEDIHACIIGFLNLCELFLHKKDCRVYITPALINSDVVENTFNQIRSTYNGANTNPNALQYRRTLNSIVLGQNTVSVKANAGKYHDSAMLFNCQPLKKPKTNKRPSTDQQRLPIKVIRC